MNRHRIKNKDSNFILSLIGLFAERPLLLKLRRILMGLFLFYSYKVRSRILCICRGWWI
jgi:hypothetical protein